ncbi:MAG TPA: hypothetical protein VNI57_14155 [Candidatus Saccharimonadales bacterium]|nr:hypothetical protein [Candidatus Saccharimonadales bacterium]
MSVLLASITAWSLLAAAPGVAPEPAVPAGVQDPGIAATTEPLREEFPGGYIDWTSGAVSAWGTISSGERRGYQNSPQRRKVKAEAVARSRLAGILAEVRVDSSHGSPAEAAVDPNQLMRLAETAGITAKREGRSENPEVEVSVSLHGEKGLAGLLDGGTPGPGAGPDSGEPADGEGGQAPTGIVIDARGSEARPSLFPRLIGPDGTEIWSRQKAAGPSCREKGMASYARVSRAPVADDDVTERVKLLRTPMYARAGSSPIRIQAVGAAGNPTTDILLDADGAAKLQSSPAGRRLLDDCRVLILLD